MNLFVRYLPVTLFLISILINPVYGGHHPSDESKTYYLSELRLFLKNGNLTYYSNVKGSFENKGIKNGAVMLGTYYSVNPNLKTGIFYRAALGERHDDDWVKEDTSWLWVNTRNRIEHYLIFDLTPRMVLDKIVNENCLGEIKSRYLYNFYNNQQTITIRPGISYFWMRQDEDRPLISIYLQDEISWALNYSKPLNSNQVYLGALYHFQENCQLGLTVSYYTTLFGPSRDYKARFSDEYWKTYNSLILGLLFIYKI